MRDKARRCLSPGRMLLCAQANGFFFLRMPKTFRIMGIG